MYYRSILFFSGIAAAICLSLSCNSAHNNAGTTMANGSSAQNMPAILAAVRKKMNSPNNLYNSEAKLAHCDSVLATVTDPMRQMILKFEKAGYLLQAGREAESVALYEELMQLRGNDPGVRKNVLPALGMAYLRLAERINCVGNHNADACIMPIRGEGIHRNKEGAQKAVGAYLAVLQEYPDNLDARWLLNIAYMTLGEYPQSVPKNWLIPGLDAPGAYPVQPFIDIAPDLGIASDQCSGGIVVDDFDNDAYLDIVTSAWGMDDPMHFYRNNGDGTFTDASDASGLSAITGGLNMVHTDYNNDGFPDIFLLRGGWQGFFGFGDQPNSLLRNNGDGTFTDVTIEAGLLSSNPSQTASWNDYNNDGWLDVFIGNETASPSDPRPCELFINNQDGTFTNVFKQSNFNIALFVKAVASGDYDNDGWPDVFISTMDGVKILLHNRGVPGKTPVFDNVAQTAGFASESSRTFPAWFFDFDNDGWLDICAWNYDFDHILSYYAAQEALHLPGDGKAGKACIYRNNRDGTFSNVSAAMGPQQSAFAMGANYGDIDNDGFLDMYLGSGNPNFESLVPNKLFKNMGGKKFIDATAAARVGNLQKGHGISFADLDNDGDQDIYINMGGAFRGDAYPNALYLNPGQGQNNWICLKLEGTRSNRAAIGAKVTLRFRENGKSRMVYREVNAGGSFGDSPFRREIGLGKATIIDEIAITWPADGSKQVLKNVAPNQFIKIREGQEGYAPVPLKKLVFRKADGSIPMCAPVQ